MLVVPVNAVSNVTSIIPRRNQSCVIVCLAVQKTNPFFFFIRIISWVGARRVFFFFWSSGSRRAIYILQCLLVWTPLASIVFMFIVFRQTLLYLYTLCKTIIHHVIANIQVSCVRTIYYIHPFLSFVSSIINVIILEIFFLFEYFISFPCLFLSRVFVPRI